MFTSLRSALYPLFCCASLLVEAQSVQTARNAAIGSSVTISGVVTNGASLGGVRYVQDATAGIAVFPGSGSVNFSAQQGDNVTLTGTLTNYNGLLEITPITAYMLNSSGSALPDPVVVTPNGINESVEGKLVRVNAVQFDIGGSLVAGNSGFSATGQSGEIYLRTGHPLIGTAVPVGPVDIVGIASQYDPSSPYNSGYQLLPRSADDFIASGTLAIIGAVQQANIVTDGFDLSWQTNIASSSYVRFGATTGLGSMVGNATNTTAHTVTLSGLAPANFYYAQVVSVLNSDTVTSPMALYSTASNSSGAIHIYFNRSVDHSVSSGTDAMALFEATDDTIKAYIDRAQSTLDIAMYNTSSTYVVNAVNAAVARGVQVRWIAEGSNDNYALASLNSSVPVLYRTDGLGSGTHDKFFAIDADDAARACVMSGSCNWTNQGLFEDYNNLVFIQDQSLARCYRREFEEMWGGSGPQPVLADSRFGAQKTDNTPHLFSIGGVAVESYFSPTDGATARIKRALDEAQQNVRFALLVLTENSLGSAVLDAHARPGVYVAGDIEDPTVAGSEFDYLVNNGVDVISHLNEPGLLHHKYAIIDEGTGADPLVVTGSHNWTSAAETVNDENTLVIHDATVANLFYQEWNARHQALVAVEEVDSYHRAGMYPDPVRDDAWIDAPMQRGTVAVMDATGRCVLDLVYRKGSALDLRPLGQGAYFFVLRDAQGAAKSSGRFVKE